MVGEYLPELKKYMSKKLTIKLNGNRVVIGRLSGFDAFMNLTIEEAVEVISATETIDIGVMVIRGNSVVQLESMDRVE